MKIFTCTKCWTAIKLHNKHGTVRFCPKCGSLVSDIRPGEPEPFEMAVDKKHDWDKALKKLTKEGR